MESKNADGGRMTAEGTRTPVTDAAAFFVELEDDEMRRKYGLELNAELVKAEDARKLERQNAALRAALMPFADIDTNTPSDLWAIRPDLCKAARRALSTGSE